MLQAVTFANIVRGCHPSESLSYFHLCRLSNLIKTTFSGISNSGYLALHFIWLPTLTDFRTRNFLVGNTIPILSSCICTIICALLGPLSFYLWINMFGFYRLVPFPFSDKILIVPHPSCKGFVTSSHVYLTESVPVGSSFRSKSFHFFNSMQLGTLTVFRLPRRCLLLVLSVFYDIDSLQLLHSEQAQFNFHTGSEAHCVLPHTNTLIMEPIITYTLWRSYCHSALEAIGLTAHRLFQGFVLKF